MGDDDVQVSVAIEVCEGDVLGVVADGVLSGDRKGSVAAVHRTVRLPPRLLAMTSRGHRLRRGRRWPPHMGSHRPGTSRRRRRSHPLRSQARRLRRCGSGGNEIGVSVSVEIADRHRGGRLGSVVGGGRKARATVPIHQDATVDLIGDDQVEVAHHRRDPPSSAAGMSARARRMPTDRVKRPSHRWPGPPCPQWERRCRPARSMSPSISRSPVPTAEAANS